MCVYLFYIYAHICTYTYMHTYVPIDTQMNTHTPLGCQKFFYCMVRMYIITPYTPAETGSRLRLVRRTQSVRHE